MQPSSLIFLVIVAIWVAYLIQHWVRRREHLATARSVDRFSEAMRVLERRSPLPSAMLATASGPAGSRDRGAPPAAGSPAGVPRSEVVVKRASVSSPLRARTMADGSLAPVHDVPPIELVPHRTATQILLRRVRGVLFLASLVAIPATLVLSAVHILKWLSVGVAVGALILVVVWLRVAAIKEQSARRARRAELRRLEQVRAAAESVSSRTTPRTSDPSRTVTSETPAREASVATTPDPTPSQPAMPAATPPAEADPGSWQPVPVPRPTYTLKDPAPRPAPVRDPLRPVPIEVEDDEIEKMAAAHGRRAVGG